MFTYSLHFHSTRNFEVTYNLFRSRTQQKVRKNEVTRGKNNALGCVVKNECKKSTNRFVFLFCFFPVCQMATHGLTALIGPLSPSAANHVQCLTSQLQVPHIETRFDYTNILSPFSFNIHPHPAKLGKVS